MHTVEIQENSRKFSKVQENSRKFSRIYWTYHCSNRTCLYVVLLGTYDDFWFLVNFQLLLYENDQIFKTKRYLKILDAFDMIQQQEQAYVLGEGIFVSCRDFLFFLPCSRTRVRKGL